MSMSNTNANEDHITDEMETDLHHDNEIISTKDPANSIKAINKTTVHKICSGQVVLTLATAVKELLENSVDANSTSVEIRLKEYGSTLIEVSDNGKGVEPCDFEGLALKHHTSKLQDFGDLIGVKTFGFRGEALSSLCALSNLSITTRHQSQSVGTKLSFNTNGRILEQTPVSRTTGTTVCLQNLFHTLPVRHKEFLRNLKKEFNKMVQVLYAYCLITTDVRIFCTNQCGKNNNKTTIVSTESLSSLRDNISSIFGHKQVASLLEINQRPPDEGVLTEYGIDDHYNSEYFRLEGYVSSCAHGKGRSSADRQFFFINNRPCDPVKVARIVNEVYHHYNKHQFPMVVLNIRMNEDDVDVNVTPDKRQILVNREKLLLATLKTTLISLYETIPSTFYVQNSSPKCFNISNDSFSTPKSHGNLDASFTSNGKTDACTTPKLSALSERFSRSNSSGSPSSQSPLNRVGKRLNNSFGGIKRALSSHSNFQTAVKQPKLEDFCFATKNNSCPKTSESEDVKEFQRNVDEVDNSQINDSGGENGQEISLDDKNGEINHSDDKIIVKCLSGENGEVNCSESNNELNCSEVKDNGFQSLMNDTDDCIIDITEERNSLTDTNSNKEMRDSPTSTSTAEMKLPAKQIHSRTDDFLSLLKRKSSSRKLEKKSLEDKIDLAKANNEENEFKLIGNEQKLTEQQQKLTENELKLTGNKEKLVESEFNLTVNEQSLKEKHKENASVIVFDGQCHKINGTGRKSLTVPFSTEILQRKLAQRKRSENGSGSINFRKFRAQIAPGESQSAEDELRKEISKDSFKQMEIIGQFNLGFIITRLNNDLFIVDQHATDEKYNFETLQKACTLQNQKLIIPQQLELTAPNEGILTDNIEIFNKNGFEFKIDEEKVVGRRVLLTSMPHSSGWEFGKEDIEEMIFMLSDSPGVMCRPSRVSAMFASRACRKSVMVGTSLGRSQMRALIDHMGEIEQPWNCPHGRPTLRHLINLDMLTKLS